MLRVVGHNGRFGKLALHKSELEEAQTSEQNEFLHRLAIIWVKTKVLFIVALLPPFWQYRIIASVSFINVAYQFICYLSIHVFCCTVEHF